ncbi:Mediator of RNA polymerase II transcription subunit 17 [Sparganum proliferum]
MQSSRGKQSLHIEALWKSNVQEITLDGREVLEKPCTAADNFQRVVNSIDFSTFRSDSVELEQKLLSESSTKVTEEMWSLLRDNIRNSLTEICALVDLLAVLKETKYLSIFRVDPKTPETPILAFLAGKKMVIFSSTLESLMSDNRCSGRLRVCLQDSANGSQASWWTTPSPNTGRIASTSHGNSPKSQFDRLCLAQNILACREILSILSHEASLRKSGESFSGITTFSIDNEVIATIFPGVKLSVSLDFVSSVDSATRSPEPPSNLQIIYGLSTQLRRILHQQHVSSWPNISSLPLPTSGPVQIPKHMRGAGALLLTTDAFLSHNTRTLSAGHAISSLPIVTASVAGFAGPAASAWMVTNSDSGAAGSSHASAGLLNQVFLGQDRHAYFTEWGFAMPSTAPLASGLPASSTTPGMDDILEACSNLSVFERSLDLSEASECAMEAIMGSGKSLLGQFLTITRHYYLRQRVAKCLAEFTQSSNMCVVVHWLAHSSPLESSAFILLHCPGYSRLRCRIGLTVTTSDLVVYFPTPQVIHLGSDIKQLWTILEVQVAKTQMHTVQELASQLLGWTRLAFTTSSGALDLQNPSATPPSIILLGSPTGNHMACIRTSCGTDLRLFIASTSVTRLSEIVTDSDALQATVRGLVANDGASAEENGDKVKAARLDSPPGQHQQDFREVDLSRVPGPHSVAKVEAILTCLT